MLVKVPTHVGEMLLNVAHIVAVEDLNNHATIVYLSNGTSYGLTLKIADAIKLFESVGVVAQKGGPNAK